MTGYDVDGALARGGPAVEVLADYVAACRALGHSAADPIQLHDAYGAEDGMDLGALEADCAAVTAALATVEEAARLQETAHDLLLGAWQGPGADAAAQYVARHAESSDQAVTALHRVADTLTELRDTLWQLVSGKVTAVQDIEDRAEREQWWPAARAVATGAGAQDAASEIVDGKVNPFVSVAIGSDWADVMASTKRSVRDAYDSAAAGMSADAPAGFGAAAPGAAAPVTPAGVSAAAPAPAADPFSAGLPAAGLGSGISSVGGGLAGVGQQLADLIGGLLSSGADASAVEPLDAGQQEPDDLVDEPDDDEDDGTGREDDEDEDEPAADNEEVPAPAAAEVTETAAPEPDPPVPTPAPEAVPAAPLAEPMAPEPVADPPRTPCEIAADELPQAGG